MKYNKIWLDGKPTLNPEGTTRINKNMVVTDQIGSWINEKGFTKIKELGLTPLGIIPLDRNDFIVFSGNGTISEIGLFDENSNYRIISNHSFWKFKNPIHGEFYRNSRNEIVISWVEEENTPKTLNIDNIPSNLTVHNTSTFPYTFDPKIKSKLLENGSLQSGTYIPICRMVGYDNSTTSWVKSYKPIYITYSIESKDYEKYEGSDSGVITNKSIRLLLSNVDTNYRDIEIGLVYVKEGVQSAFSVKKVPVQSTVVDITNIDNASSITLEEVVVDKALYKTADKITSFQDGLYLHTLTSYKEDNLQLEVNKLQFKWVSELVLPTVPRTNILSGSDKYHDANNEKRTFAHDEVYALYFRVGYYYGNSKWFLCIGREGTNSEKLTSLVSKNGKADGVFKNYQVFDTCSGTILSSGLNSGIAEGIFSFWENENELYPNTGYYPTGNVKHFKFPSHNWIKNNIWTANTYGVMSIDKLGIKPINIDLNNFKDCDGNTPLYYEIGYAKRNLTDTRVQGQSIGINKHYRLLDKEDQIISLGGNWNDITSGTKTKQNPNVGTKRNMSVYPFELLRTKPSLTSNFLRLEYKLRNTNALELSTITKNVFSQLDSSSDALTRSILSDYSVGVYSTSSSVLDTSSLVLIKNQKYILNNSLFENYDNLYTETNVNIEYTGNTNIFDNTKNFDSDSTSIRTFEENTGLLTLLNIKTDYNLDFVNKEIVNTDIKETTNVVIWGGDTYICDYSINTYGKPIAIGYNDAEKATENKSLTANGDKYNGTRASHRFLCESKFNINLRHTASGFTKETSYYPNITGDSKFHFLNILEKDIEPNNFTIGYNPDFHVQNLLEAPNIFDYKKEYDNNYPNRIVTSGILNKEFAVNTWRDWKQANYYELPSNLGKCVNLEVDKNFIYIHYEKELLRTIGRQVLDLTSKEITIGTGDIFKNIPEPITHDVHGYLGTQHQQSCCMTPYGYCFMDAEKGMMWLIENGTKPVPISEDGLMNFFKDTLISKGSNNEFGFITYFDERYKRLVVTSKSKKDNNNFNKKFKGVWRNEQDFINTLQQGDIVIKDNKYKIVN